MQYNLSADNFLPSLSTTHFTYLAARSGAWMVRESTGSVAKWQIFWAVEHSVTQSWVVTLPGAGVVPTGLCWAPPGCHTVAALLRQEEGWSLQLVLKQENKLTDCKWRKKCFKGNYGTGRLSPGTGWVCYQLHGWTLPLPLPLWGFCRDTKSAPAADTAAHLRRSITGF